MAETNSSNGLERAFALLEALPDPIILLNESRMVVRANSAAKALLPTLASSAGQPIGISRLIRDPDFLDAVDQIVDGDLQAEIKLTLPGPVDRHLGVTMVSIAEDMQQLGKAHQNAATMLIRFSDETLLRRSEQMRADFIANASHELRTPLAALIGYIETLQGPAKDDMKARDHFLGIMSDQARRMHRLINDLLSLSRIELDEHQAPRNPVKVSDLISSALDAVGAPGR